MHLSAAEREVDALEEELAELDPQSPEARDLNQRLREIAQEEGEREEWEERGRYAGWL